MSSAIQVREVKGGGYRRGKGRGGVRGPQGRKWGNYKKSKLSIRAMITRRDKQEGSGKGNTNGEWEQRN